MAMARFKLGWHRMMYVGVGLVLLLVGYKACRWIVPSKPDVYTVAVDPTWHPLSLYGNEGAITAFSTDVLFAAARREKLNVELVRAGPKRLFDLLDDELVQGVLTGVRVTTELEGQYYFSEPYYLFGAVLIIKKNDDFKNLLELHSKRVAVKRNSSILFKIQLDPTAVIVPFDSPVGALEQLLRGEVDGVIMDQLLAYLYFAGSYREKFKIVTLPLTMDGLRLATLQDRAGELLIEAFDAGLKSLKDDGSYLKFLEQWGLYNPELLQNHILEYP